MRISLLTKSGALFEVDHHIEPVIETDTYGNEVINFTEDHNIHLTLPSGMTYNLKEATIKTKCIEATFQTWQD